MNEKAQLAFNFASEVSKQLITIASGVLAISITFLKDFSDTSEQRKNISGTLKWGWILLLLSLFFGIWALMAMTGSLAKSQEATGKELYQANIAVPTMLQISTFLAGFVLMTYFAWNTISKKHPSARPPKRRARERTHRN